MLLTVSPLRCKVGELYILYVNPELFSVFCTKQVLLIPKIVLPQSHSGLNKVEMYVFCNSRPVSKFEVITDPEFFCLLLHFPYIGFHPLDLLMISE